MIIITPLILNGNALVIDHHDIHLTWKGKRKETKETARHDHRKIVCWRKQVGKERRDTNNAWLHTLV